MTPEQRFAVLEQRVTNMEIANSNLSVVVQSLVNILRKSMNVAVTVPVTIMTDQMITDEFNKVKQGLIEEAQKKKIIVPNSGGGVISVPQPTPEAPAPTKLEVAPE